MGEIKLFWSRRCLEPSLVWFGLSVRFADLMTKTAPIFTGFKTTAAVGLFDLTAQDIAAVGAVPERGFSDHCYQPSICSGLYSFIPDWGCGSRVCFASDKFCIGALFER
jgi:hypothetical protein